MINNQEETVLNKIVDTLEVNPICIDTLDSLANDLIQVSKDKSIYNSIIEEIDLSIEYGYALNANAVSSEILSILEG